MKTKPLTYEEMKQRLERDPESGRETGCCEWLCGYPLPCHKTMTLQECFDKHPGGQTTFGAGEYCG